MRSKARSGSSRHHLWRETSLTETPCLCCTPTMTHHRLCFPLETPATRKAPSMYKDGGGNSVRCIVCLWYWPYRAECPGSFLTPGVSVHSLGRGHGIKHAAWTGVVCHWYWPYRDECPGSFLTLGVSVHSPMSIKQRLQAQLHARV